PRYRWGRVGLRREARVGASRSPSAHPARPFADRNGRALLAAAGPRAEAPQPTQRARVSPARARARREGTRRERGGSGPRVDGERRDAVSASARGIVALGLKSAQLSARAAPTIRSTP